MQSTLAPINIEFSSEARKTVSKISSSINSDIERGGILIGFVNKNFGVKVTEVFETDGGGVHNFSINADQANKRIEQARHAVDYLVGIWHTHNRDFAYPTMPDLAPMGIVGDWDFPIYPIQLIIAKENCFLMNLFNLSDEFKAKAEVKD